MRYTEFKQIIKKELPDDQFQGFKKLFESYILFKNDDEYECIIYTNRTEFRKHLWDKCNGNDVETQNVNTICVTEGRTHKFYFYVST